jgi:DNA-binding transcriptional LysR family regulator
MDQRHLRAAVVLAEELHFGRAARRLHVVQSAVSQTLRALEEEVGAALFDRSRRQVRLTPAGEAFVAHARRALDAADEAGAAARRAAAGETGTLVLRCTLMAALGPMPAALARFRGEAPEVRVEVAPLGTRDQLEALRAGRCDVGFATWMTSARGLRVEPVRVSPLVALLPAGHRLAERAELRAQDFATEPLVALSRASEPLIWQRFSDGCARAGFTPRVALEVDQVDTLLAFVAAGLGCSFAPAHVHTLRVEGVVQRPFLPTVPSGTVAVWNPDRLTPVAERFLTALRACVAASP